MKHRDKKAFDIVVIGAGHAGCEAALAAARMNCSVLVLAINVDKIAHMPCNPAIGGIGKGQLVREIDALGGQMGKTIDETLIQIKVLNRSKGPAVQALRAQADKRAYSRLMKLTLLAESNIKIRQEEVKNIKRLSTEELSVETALGNGYSSRCVVLTTGTFLKGQIIIGDRCVPGGRAGELPSTGLSASLRSLGVDIGRFQSATPPRVMGRTIDKARMIRQPGEAETAGFSFETKKHSNRRQIDCWLTYTNKQTNEAVNRHMHLSPIKSGAVSAKGPRYCPSIDRKVINFPDRDRHPVFVEPEGRRTEEMYLQGLTTSMPIEVQEKIIQTVPGLEAAQIIRPGYAVAYDFVKPHQLKNTLECHEVTGLFTAGQINGTSGYEEAAAQGLVAGINAALLCSGGEPFVLDRSQAYIGVLIDDLVTKEIDEPYRMFTSRAEHRLILRSDNADLRLSGLGYSLGLISRQRFASVEKKVAQIEECHKKLKATTIVPHRHSHLVTEAISARKLLKRPNINIDDLVKIVKLGRIPKDARRQAEVQVKYEGYINKQLVHIAAQRRQEDVLLPQLNYKSIEALSIEARQKLALIKPKSLGQAARIAGVTPADISILMIFLEQTRCDSLKN